jgi:REP element-mobilizing transposase RayT
MKYNPDIHHRSSIRLKGYDYSGEGAYFVTICAAGHECLFGEVADGEMCLNDAGRMVQTTWNELQTHYPGVQEDIHVVMPNHFHGIVLITDLVGAGLSRPPIPNGSSSLCLDNIKGIHGITSAQEMQDQGGMTPNDEGGMTPNDEGGMTPPLRIPTLGRILGYFKYRSTKEVNDLLGNLPGPIWQRGYYERIIRGEKELVAARRYILENPIKWAMDKENPANVLGK